jgi:hypothetical protein
VTKSRRWSPLFQTIIDNDAARSELKRAPVIPFDAMRRLGIERRDLTRAAEQALSWNTDKGNKAR